MDLSIIIPLYNQGHYLEECLESISKNEARKIKSKETIVVDDCSSDNSFEVAKKLQDKFKFELIQTPQNSKLPGARNFALKQASGKYVICLDSDDKIPPNYIHETHRTLIKKNVDVAYADSQCFDYKTSRYQWPEFSVLLLKRGPFINCSAMYKKEIWDKVGGYKEDMIYGWEDYEFWVSAYEHGYKFKKCNRTELYYRMKDDGMGATAATKHQQEIWGKLKEYHPNFFGG